MYGLVNKAIEDMVCTRFGDEAWSAICEKANVGTEVFVCMDSYPDDITYQLVGAASEVLNLSVPDVLKAFGEYWVEYTGEEGYGEMLSVCGSTIQEFLQNLDALHSRVGMIYPELMPPSFCCTDVTSHSLHLHYYSKRQGLAPMVVGLLQGLGTRFHVTLETTQLEFKGSGSDHDVFFVEIQRQEALE